MPQNLVLVCYLFFELFTNDDDEDNDDDDHDDDDDDDIDDDDHDDNDDDDNDDDDDGGNTVAECHPVCNSRERDLSCWRPPAVEPVQCFCGTKKVMETMMR